MLALNRLIASSIAWFTWVPLGNSGHTARPISSRLTTDPFLDSSSVKRSICFGVREGGLLFFVSGFGCSTEWPGIEGRPSEAVSRGCS